ARPAHPRRARARARGPWLPLAPRAVHRRTERHPLLRSAAGDERTRTRPSPRDLQGLRRLTRREAPFLAALRQLDERGGGRGERARLSLQEALASPSGSTRSAPRASVSARWRASPSTPSAVAVRRESSRESSCSPKTASTP